MFRANRKILIMIALLAALARPAPGIAQESPFPVPPGIEDAVAFWRQVFTQYGFADVVLFDPLDPSMIYKVVRAPENEQGRALIEKERARIAADYELVDEESRLRSQRGAKEHFAEGLRISGRYIAQMQKIFREEGLPAELAYLPLVESSFNVRARSGVGAVGMWQFMPETGKKFMRIDGQVDERRDPMASTRAAARLLKQNFRLFGSWPLAITAYNHGTEGVFRGIKEVESDNLVNLIRHYQSPTFGFASKNFYAEFLAVVEIATNRDTHFPYLRSHPPMALREVTVKRQAPLRSLLQPAAITHAEFFDWNPALDPKAKFVPVGYAVKLPPEKVAGFVAAERRASMTAANRKTPSAVKSSARGKVSAVRGRSSKPAKKSGARNAVKLASARNSKQPVKAPAADSSAALKTASR